jgi:hypothetical protein
MRVNRLTALTTLVTLLLGSAVLASPRGAAARRGAGGGPAARGGGSGGGTVLSVDATALSFVVQSRGAQVTVTTTSTTVFQKSDGSAAAFSDLAIGAQVKVQGSATGTNAVTATTVLILGGAGSGTVLSVDTEALTFVVQPKDSTLASITVTTTATTVFQRSDGTTATFADVVAGTRVLVQSTVTGTDTVEAQRVLILTGNGSCEGTAGSGTVLSVDAALTFVVQARSAQITVTTSSATVFQRSDGTAATFADVVVGAQVAVKGAVTGDDTVDAQKVVITTSSTAAGRRRSRR